MVSLVGLVLLALPLGVLSHGLSDHRQQTARLTAAAAMSTTYVARTSNADFGAGTRSQLVVTGGDLRIGTARTTRTWAGRTYEYGTWTSSWTTPARHFNELVPSWSAGTPGGSWIQVLVQVGDAAGHVSTAKDVGRWSVHDSTFKRSSAGSQSDGVARVSTDTVVATKAALTRYRFVVRLMRTPGGATPALHAIGAATTLRTSALPSTSTPLQKTAVSLAVPAYSQMTHRGHAPQYGGGGEAWCSPTSLSMVLGYYQKLPPASSYGWVPKKYADRWVDHVARLTYDYAYSGTGNWPFNTAYAATRVDQAFVTRLPHLRTAERFVRAGIPLVLSIKFAKGQLAGAPISATAGHLVVLTGFTAAGNPIVNDPAAPTNGSVRRTYDRAQFERAWLRGSAGTAYVLRDAKHLLPARPSGIHAW
ncbi:MAG: hypothetical protein JWQ74_1537 [Marmoricola sp.]|nr:hypothetical protein [Marmoricola sp.]